MRDFKISIQFLEKFSGKQPLWGPLGYVVYKRTYSRQKEDGTLEEFWETCQRVVEGVYSAQKAHCRSLRLPWNNDKAQRSAQEMYQRLWDFKWSPPGRGFWMMGTEHIDKLGGAALNSCGFVSTDQIKTSLAEPFCWMMDMLMLGVGVGFDTKGAGTIKIQEPRRSNEVHVVEDSREGWVELLRRTLTAYTGKGSLPNEVDYSQVRKLGAPISGFGGTASGPGPLIELVKYVNKYLEVSIGEEVTSGLIVDIATLVGRCVVSGNVRRSAAISFGDPDDEVFLELKDPEKNPEKLTLHRWASNNSVFAEIGMDYEKVASRTVINGEPGYMWLKNAQDYSRMGRDPDFKDHRVMGANPCNEQSLERYETCVLAESYPANHDSHEDYLKTLKYAYLYAKSVTLIPTHNERTNAVMMRNRRIGCSMSGIVQAITKFGRRDFFQMCEAGYSYLERLDGVYSDWLCIPKSVKRTSVKPSGSISLLSAATPGIHFPHSEYYIRRIRFQESHPMVGAIKKCGYKIEKDAYSPNTVVVEFPVKEAHFDRSKSQVSMWEQLENAAQMQTYWADNQVSVTITFTEEEASQIKYALELYETRLKGVSFLPLKDHGYVQAPYEEITEEQYNSMSSTILWRDLPGLLVAATNNVHDTTDKFCTNDTCEVKLD